MKVNKMKKKQLSQNPQITQQYVYRPQYFIGKQLMTQLMAEIQDYKTIISISNHKFQDSSKSIADKQKYIIIELETHKRIMLTKLQALKKQIYILRNLPQYQIPFQIFQKQEKITTNQQRMILQKMLGMQYIRTKEAQEQYEIAKANYMNLNIQARIQGVLQQKVQVTKQLQRLKKSIQEEGKQTILYQQESKQVYEEKKKQNNLLQETKGNIRVYCRLRPAHNQRIDYQVTDNLIRLKRDKSELKSKNRVEEYEYLFQKIFGEDIPQNLVFQQLAQLVQCSVDGKNVCIFAYGQTGSGKTHTMTGSLDRHKHEMRGFIPRSIQYIFDQVQIAKSNGYQADISVCICEVYNDKIFDLLSYSFQRGSSSDSKKNISQPKYTKPLPASGSKKYLSQEKSTQDLVEFIVTTPQQALLAMSNALKRRTTAQTKMNTESSRSHLIFQIRNEFYNPHTKVSRCSSLVLVDLAGSERQKDSGVTGIRLQEAKSINNSLTQLGKVMRAIKDQERPSFRNCKLTMILQKYLQSDSKAVMFVNVSPDKKDLDQTVNSLVFAQSVRECKLKNNKNLKTTSTF